MANNFPKLHNAAWPGVVGKGDDSEPPISLDRMIELTAGAEPSWGLADLIPFATAGLIVLTGTYPDSAPQ